jgi:hypothetical protein
MASLSCDAPATTSWHFGAVEVGPSAPSSGEADSIRRDRSIPACPPWRGRYPGIGTINATALAAAPAEIAGAPEPGWTRPSGGADDFTVSGSAAAATSSAGRGSRRHLAFNKHKPSNRSVRTCPALFRIKVWQKSAPKVDGVYSATQPHNAAALCILLLRRVQTMEQNWPSGRRKTRPVFGLSGLVA